VKRAITLVASSQSSKLGYSVDHKVICSHYLVSHARVRCSLLHYACDMKFTQCYVMFRTHRMSSMVYNPSYISIRLLAGLGSDVWNKQRCHIYSTSYISEAKLEVSLFALTNYSISFYINNYV